MGVMEDLSKYGTTAIAVSICILNTLQIFAIHKFRKQGLRRKQQTLSTLFLLNLAYSDLSVGIILFTIKVISCELERRGTKGSPSLQTFVAVLTFYFLRFSLLTSVLNLMALTMDRKTAIEKPLLYHSGKRRKQAVITCILIWVSAFAITGILYAVFHHGSSVFKRHILVIFPICIFPAALFFCVCYWSINKAMKSQTRVLLASRITTGLVFDSSVSHALQREIRISKFSALVTLGFVFCWLPISIVGIVFLFGVKIANDDLNPLFILAFLNSVLNPLLYFGFRRDLWKSIKCFGKREKLEIATSNRQLEVGQPSLLNLTMQHRLSIFSVGSSANLTDRSSLDGLKQEVDEKAH